MSVSRSATQFFLRSAATSLKPNELRGCRVPTQTGPIIPPSSALHVSQSQGEVRSNCGGGDFTALRGYTLKEAITYLYGVDQIRVLLPASLDDSKRYDFSIVLPAQEESETIKAHVQQGLLDYFNLYAKRENRSEEVYVVAAAQGRTPPLAKRHVADHMAFGSGGSVEFTSDPSDVPANVPGGIKRLSVSTLRGLSLDGTADEFCGTLERILDRPVVNETTLQGDFEFHVERREGSPNDFLERLRDQSGLTIAPARRNVEIIVFDFR
jgi:uncharacterized protein (TIGR03435 family)